MFDVRRLLPFSSIRPDSLYFRVLALAGFLPSQFRLDKHVDIAVHDCLNITGPHINDRLFLAVDQQKESG